MEKGLTPPKAQGKYEQLKFNAMNAGGNYMPTTAPLTHQNFFEMVYILYERWYLNKIEVHYSDLLSERIVPFIALFENTFAILGIEVTGVEVKELIPYQVFIMPAAGMTWISGDENACISVIDPIGIEIYVEEKSLVTQLGEASERLDDTISLIKQNTQKPI